MASRKTNARSKLGQSPWIDTKNKMSPVTKKNTTPQPNKGAYEPGGKGYPKKQKTGGGTPSRGK
jgi:hypothetical protein